MRSQAKGRYAVGISSFRTQITKRVAVCNNNMTYEVKKHTILGAYFLHFIVNYTETWIVGMETLKAIKDQNLMFAMIMAPVYVTNCIFFIKMDTLFLLLNGIQYTMTK